jgi:hypothetical protein
MLLVRRHAANDASVYSSFLGDPITSWRVRSKPIEYPIFLSAALGYNAICFGAFHYGLVIVDSRRLLKSGLWEG